MGKQYDEAYFDRWYRREGFGSRAELDRKVSYALASTEYLLQRPVRSVLDVGCGEGAWQVALKRQRPRARYTGVDPSTYAVDRFGGRRNLLLGGIGELETVLGPDRFDLVVCADVIPYAPASDVRLGLVSIVSRLRGAAFIEFFTSTDDFAGDLTGYQRRSPATYRRWFAAAGLERIGPALFAGPQLLPELSTLERGP
jgi:SAM-dependent methyltransferase